MKDVSFYDIVISKKDQRIVSADAWIYDAFGPYATKPMNEMIAIEDMEILDAVIQRFGKLSKNEIVEMMHNEDAYTETAPHDIIQFKYAKTLSVA